MSQEKPYVYKSPIDKTSLSKDPEIQSITSKEQAIEFMKKTSDLFDTGKENRISASAKMRFLMDKYEIGQGEAGKLIGKEGWFGPVNEK